MIVGNNHAWRRAEALAVDPPDGRDRRRPVLRIQLSADPRRVGFVPVDNRAGPDFELGRVARERTPVPKSPVEHVRIVPNPVHIARAGRRPEDRLRVLDEPIIDEARDGGPLLAATCAADVGEVVHLVREDPVGPEAAPEVAERLPCGGVPAQRRERNYHDADRELPVSAE